MIAAIIKAAILGAVLSGLLALLTNGFKQPHNRSWGWVPGFMVSFVLLLSAIGAVVGFLS